MDDIVHSFSGQYIWRRRKVWAWEVKGLEADGWSRDKSSGLIRPVMVRREEVITPASVEAAIEAVGRDAVFARAQELGWTPDNPPPLWVWQLIAVELGRTSAPTIH